MSPHGSTCHPDQEHNLVNTFSSSQSQAQALGGAPKGCALSSKESESRPLPDSAARPPGAIELITTHAVLTSNCNDISFQPLRSSTQAS